MGRIDDVALNPESKQIEFALVDMAYPTNTGTVTPVPWQLLNYVWDQGQVGGTPGAVQLFRLDLDKGRLAQAAKIDRKQIAELLQPQFRQQLLAFFGGSSEYAGATGTATAETSGGTSGGAASTSTTAQPAGASSATTGVTGTGATTPPLAYSTPGFIFLAPNGTTNISDTNRVLFVTNTFVTNIVQETNGSLLQTNFAQGTNRNLGGGTNLAQGGSNTLMTPTANNRGQTNAVLSPTGRTTSGSNVVSQQPASQTEPAQATVPSTAAPATTRPPPNSPWVPPSTIPAPATPPANGSATQPSASTPDILPPATPSRPGSIFQPPNPAPPPQPAPQRPVR